jgi:hypothetical protein
MVMQVCSMLLCLDLQLRRLVLVRMSIPLQSMVGCSVRVVLVLGVRFLVAFRGRVHMTVVLVT